MIRKQNRKISPIQEIEMPMVTEVTCNFFVEFYVSLNLKMSTLYEILPRSQGHFLAPYEIIVS